MEVTIGEKAPSFTLRATDKSEISLSDFKGKNVLLLFFPLAFTGTCTAELCSVRDNLSKYENLDAEVLAVSVDSLFVLEKYKSENNYNFTLLSDFNTEISRSYGVLYDVFVLDMKNVAKRSAFVIDKLGTIRYAEVLENATELPNFAEISKTLEDLNQA